MLIFWLEIICTIRRAHAGLITVSGQRIEREAVVFVFETLLLIKSLVEIVQFVFGRRDVLLGLLKRERESEIEVRFWSKKMFIGQLRRCAIFKQ